jgi:hypothetical protein
VDGSCPVARSGVNCVETSGPATALLVVTSTSVYQHISVHMAESVLHNHLLQKAEHLYAQICWKCSRLHLTVIPVNSRHQKQDMTYHQKNVGLILWFWFVESSEISTK